MVTVRIQHHPSRASLLDALSEALAPLPVEVITDPEPNGLPNPWRCYQACLTDLPADGHVLILQDDVAVCRNFPAVLEQISAANPDTPVCLYVGGRVYRTSRFVRQAHARGQRYLPIIQSDPLPVVATLWPVRKAAEFRDWSAAHPFLVKGKPTRSDDQQGHVWMQRTRQTVLATVPSLVEHLGVQSLIKPRLHVDNRRAELFIGDTDPLTYNWTR